MANLVTLGTDDAADLHALQTAAYAIEESRKDTHLPTLNQSLETVAAELNDPDMLCYGLRDEQDALVAAVRGFLDTETETATVGRLCVHPEKQGQGIATFLLTEIERHVPEHIRELQIFTGADAATSHHFYSKLGYVDVKHEDMESGITIVQLKKNLA
ncbi:MAG TPA: GNAT family N-acetyltransferase [Jatrophihabitans sp.]|jgi:tRNA (guanine37-N1)-methyltransferase